jgi:hypothetical protein
MKRYKAKWAPHCILQCKQEGGLEREGMGIRYRGGTSDCLCYHRMETMKKKYVITVMGETGRKEIVQ